MGGAYWMALLVAAFALLLVPGCASAPAAQAPPSQPPATQPAVSEQPPAEPPPAEYDAAKLAKSMEDQWGEAGSFASPPKHASWYPEGLTYEVSDGKVAVRTPLYSKSSNKSDAWKLGSEAALAAKDVYGFQTVHVQVFAKNGDLLATADVIDGQLQRQ